MLKRIKKPSVVHRMPQDIRHHTFGISRILYLVMLLSIVGFILNYIFYDYYILYGDGFVDSEVETVSLEYDASIKDVFVENGDRVKSGQPLFSFDSIEFRSILLKAYNDYIEIVSKRQSVGSNISRLKASIESSEEFLKSISQARQILNNLDKKGYATTDRVLSEEMRKFTVLRDLLQFKAELTANLKSFDELDLVVASSRALVKSLIADYNAGIKTATYDGVIARSNHYPGAVVKKSDPVMKFYYGPKYLTVLFENSHVRGEIGDPVIVTRDDGSAKTIGRIAFLGEYASDIPDEIRPRYRPPGRRNVAQIVVDENFIQNQEMLSIARVYKPIGMGFLCLFMDCEKSKEYLTQYEAFSEQRKKQSEKKLELHALKNKEFIRNLDE